MSFEPVDFYVKDTSPQKAPVPGVVVKVLSRDGKLTYSQTSTDADGRAGFMLPSGVPYQARFFKFQVGFVNPQYFDVYENAPNVFDVAAETLTPPVPLDARLCTAYGFFRDITGAPQPNVDIHFIAQFDPVWLEGAAVLKERVIIRSDEKGYAQVNLIRNAKYDVTVQGAEDVVRTISVPDAPNVNLADLLFPVVSQVVLDPPGPYTLAVGEELPIEVDVVASDGERLGIGLREVMYSSTATSVVTFRCAPQKLTLIGVAPGTAQINIVRADQSIVRIPDPGIQGQPLLVTVTL